MHILFFTKGDQTVASSRYRVWLVADRLQKQYGWQYEVVHSISYPLFSLRLSRVKTFFSVWYKLQVSSGKLFFVHKSFFPWDVVLLIITIKKLFGKKLIYDLDDAEWIHSPTVPGARAPRRRPAGASRRGDLLATHSPVRAETHL